MSRMKVILLKDMNGLGKIGDIVDVKKGYGRNFLIPRKLALLYTKAAEAIFKELQNQETLRKEKIKKSALKLKERLETLSLTMCVHAGEDGKIFGSVTNKDISELLKKEGYEIDKKNILIAEEIRELGVYSVDIDLHPEIKAKVKVWVVSDLV